VRVPPYDPLKLLDRHLIGVTALMRRELVADTGGFDPAFAALEDWELWLNALEHGWEGVLVPRVALEYRRHERSKLRSDRRAYRRARRRIMAKHAALYARRRELAARSPMGAAQRAAYRFYWGPRPVPAVVEQAAYEVLLRGARSFGGGARRR
jgi:GT2 family glycosyltransferase